MQQRWFISYHSSEHGLAQRLRNGIERHDPNSSIFFAATSMRAGGFWTSQLANEIAVATALVLIVGDQGVGPWQVLEYGEALDRKVLGGGDFPILVLLQEGQTAPGLPFLRQLQWVVSKDLASDATIALLFDAVAGRAAPTRQLWRYTSPYRGLAAMEQKDSDYFFGRSKETAEVLSRLQEEPNKIPILLGNSGVGKSSLAQAGVLAALVRQSWPQGVTDPWPSCFRNSRRWCFLSLRPGAEPVKSLVEAFLETWQLDGTSTEWPERRAAWIEKLVNEKLSLGDLIDQTSRRYLELQQSKPESYFIYVDQAEELYLRSDLKQRDLFSKLLQTGVAASRTRALLSMRSDFLGELQRDQPLYSAHVQINVPPLREEQLLQVVSGPAALLDARFELPNLPADLAQRAAEDSIRDAGALPLLSYLLDGMWRQMIERGDGILRLPVQSIDLGRVLVDRANSFIGSNPNSEKALRRIFTLRLATVREDGEPTRRRAARSEFNDDEWRLVTQLANDPYRLLSTFSPEMPLPLHQLQGTETSKIRNAGSEQVYTEVAHEAIFRRWDKLRSWIAAEREFLSWRTGVELARRGWETAPTNSKSEAILMGLALRQALNWLSTRSEDIPVRDREFITLSRHSTWMKRLRTQALVGVVLLLSVGTIGLWEYGKTLRTVAFRLTQVAPKTDDEIRALEKGVTFHDCAGCPEMAVIPTGHIFMGSPTGQGLPREHPQRKVNITQPFAVSIFEITLEEWDLCSSLGDCDPRIGTGVSDRGKQPVINISWYDAKHYTEWLSKITQRRYRLLSEAEWEYSARAGEQGLYAFGNDDDTFLKQYAWYDANSGSQPNPVGQKKPNSFGLYDMHGNVSEWVEDCYLSNYPPEESNGSPFLSSNCGRRVVRGGSWRFGPFALRSANRDSAGVDSSDDDRGMRIARDLYERQ